MALPLLIPAAAVGGLFVGFFIGRNRRPKRKRPKDFPKPTPTPALPSVDDEPVASDSVPPGYSEDYDRLYPGAQLDQVDPNDQLYPGGPAAQPTPQPAPQPAPTVNIPAAPTPVAGVIPTVPQGVNIPTETVSPPPRLEMQFAASSPTMGPHIRRPVSRFRVS